MKKEKEFLIYFLKMIFIIISFFALYAFAKFQGGFVSWFLFYSFLPFLLFAFFLGVYPIRQWKIQRNIQPHHYEAGDTVNITLIMKRKFPFPLYCLVICDRYTYGQYKKMIFPLWKRKCQVTYELTDVKRGELIFDEITIEVVDFLGLMKKRYRQKLKTSLLIYPKLQPLSLYFFDNKGGEGNGTQRKDRKQEAFVPVSVREYQRGDRLSWVNWKMTAKQNTLMSKEFEKTIAPPYVICMDRSHTISANIFENMVAYTASLWKELSRRNEKVELITIGKEQSQWTLKQVTRSTKDMMHYFAVAVNDAKADLFELIVAEKASLPKKGIFIWITETLSEQLLQQAQYIASVQRQVMIVSFSEIDEQMNTDLCYHPNIMLQTIKQDGYWRNEEASTV